MLADLEVDLFERFTSAGVRLILERMELQPTALGLIRDLDLDILPRLTSLTELSIRMPAKHKEREVLIEQIASLPKLKVLHLYVSSFSSSPDPILLAPLRKLSRLTNLTLGDIAVQETEEDLLSCFPKLESLRYKHHEEQKGTATLHRILQFAPRPMCAFYY